MDKKNIIFVVGPEGGFEQSEVDLAEGCGALTVSLGKRILRAETASITALSMLMLHAEMNLE
jgi:16S rRNA (uracil1498-N3)-methyltransferase